MFFATTSSYAQKWEVGTGVGISKYSQSNYYPPYNNTVLPTFNLYIERKNKRFNIIVNHNYFERTCSSLDTFKIPIYNQYPRTYKDSLGFYNAWKEKNSLIKINCNYNIFNIKELKMYLGIGAEIIWGKQYFVVKQTNINNNYVSWYNNTNRSTNVYIDISYQLSYNISQHINIQNIFSYSLSTDPGLTSTFKEWPALVSDYIGVGYVF